MDVFKILSKIVIILKAVWGNSILPYLIDILENLMSSAAIHSPYESDWVLNQDFSAITCLYKTTTTKQSAPYSGLVSRTQHSPIFRHAPVALHEQSCYLEAIQEIQPFACRRCCKHSDRVQSYLFLRVRDDPFLLGDDSNLLCLPTLC